VRLDTRPVKSPTAVPATPPADSALLPSRQLLVIELVIVLARHWEGDLILGKGGTSTIGTVVERASRFVLLVHLAGRRTALDFQHALVPVIGSLPDQPPRGGPAGRDRQCLPWFLSRRSGEARVRGAPLGASWFRLTKHLQSRSCQG
jgi:hypothetical protein